MIATHRFRVTVRHDHGKANLVVTVLHEYGDHDGPIQKAVDQICAVEGCPESAIINIKRLE